MEVGSLNNVVQTPIMLREAKIQETNNQVHQPSRQDILDKVKIEPGYIPTIQEKAVIKAIETANQKLNGGPREFEFSIHEKTKQIMVKVIDSSTKEVIREIPPEKILDMVANMCEAAGLFVDEKR